MLLCGSHLFGKQSESFGKSLKAFVVGIRSEFLLIRESIHSKRAGKLWK